MKLYLFCSNICKIYVKIKKMVESMANYDFYSKKKTT